MMPVEEMALLFVMTVLIVCVKNYLNNALSTSINCATESHTVKEKLMNKYQFVALQRGGNETVSLLLPLAWLTDGTEDCIGREDEKEGYWPTCGFGKSWRYVRENKTCSNVFLCRSGDPGFVELQGFCDGTDTCGNENRVCRVARNAPSVTTEVLAELVDH